VAGGAGVVTHAGEIAPATTRRSIAWISQAAMQSLNPVRTVGSQLREVARMDGDRKGVGARIDSALGQVGLSRH